MAGDDRLLLGCIRRALEDEAVEDDTIVPEWEEVMRKHRALAGRLEQLTSGQAAGGGTQSISRMTSPVH